MDAVVFNLGQSCSTWPSQECTEVDYHGIRAAQHITVSCPVRLSRRGFCHEQILAHGAHSPKSDDCSTGVETVTIEQRAAERDSSSQRRLSLVTSYKAVHTECRRRQRPSYRQPACIRTAKASRGARRGEARRGEAACHDVEARPHASCCGTRRDSSRDPGPQPGLTSRSLPKQALCVQPLCSRHAWDCGSWAAFNLQVPAEQQHQTSPPVCQLGERVMR